MRGGAKPVRRRSFLAAAAATVGTVALGGCGGESGGSKKKTLSVFSWWSGGGEEAGLRKLVEVFKKENPNITFRNEAVAGGAGERAKKELATRMRNGNPPDTFQGHAGAELNDYIDAGQLEDLSFIYDDTEIWRPAFPYTLLDLLQRNGKTYSIPVNIHRANLLWHNASVLDDAGIAEPPKSFDDFFDALERVKAAGRTPLVMGEPWTYTHLLETVLLGTLGDAEYSDLWGTAGNWGGSAMTKALKRYADLLEYTDGTHDTRSWQQSAKLVADGDAGFIVMGDWIDSYFTGELDLRPRKHYGWSATPGTGRMYQFLSDSFTLPVGAENRDAAIAWLKTCGSQAGQDAFNPSKGSIPARIDADKSLYGPYLQWAIDQWADNDTIVGSLTHGVVADTRWTTAITEVLADFRSGGSVDRLQENLGNAAADNA
jgi:glucose/mannose transport system substrate-binding protein